MESSSTELVERTHIHICTARTDGQRGVFMLDFTNTQAQVLADNEVVINGHSFGKLTDTDTERLITIIRGMQSGISVGTPTQASKSKQERTYDPATDVTLPIAVVKATKTKFAFTLGYGSGRAGAKLLIKQSGFAWDADAKAWAGTPANAEKLGLTKDSTTLAVPADSVQAGRDKAAAKAAKRAGKEA